MKRILAAAIAVSVLPVAGMAESVYGDWKTSTDKEGNHLIVSFAACKDMVCGTIKGAYNAQGEKYAGYEAEGKRMVYDMQPEGNGSYKDGKIWDPESDGTYSASMTVEGSSLKVKGCAVGGLLCDTDTWTRAK
ncbi:DUF2147 domain-containing protein [Ruegeria halocynthiae]|uniref:DUF2147 domain-containing protein n=1 Tax=Ruegeria halocynthiae TaxID=985054 RepID=UPI000561C31A|nr:DUF2147 domain-containing protein [Ruegeria halocynthiae]